MAHLFNPASASAQIRSSGLCLPINDVAKTMALNSLPAQGLEICESLGDLFLHVVEMGNTLISIVGVRVQELHFCEGDER